MAKQPATMTDKKLATKVEGHEIQKPTLRDRDWDREVSSRNDQNIVNLQADSGIKEVEHSDERPHLSDVSADLTKDVKESK